MQVLRRTFHHLATPAVAATAVGRPIDLAQRFPDHAPVVIDYDFTR